MVQGLLSCPAEITVQIISLCDGLADMLALASTCRQLHVLWKKAAPPLIWSTGRRDITAFEEALMAVRATNLVRPAFEAGELPPRITSVGKLTGASRKPVMPSSSRLFLAGAVLAHAYHEPFFRSLEQGERYFSEPSTRESRDRDNDYLGTFAVYNHELLGDKNAEAFGPLSSWLVETARTEASGRGFIPYWKRPAYLAERSEEEEEEEDDDGEGRDGPLTDQDVFPLWELMRMWTAHELSQIRLDWVRGTNHHSPHSEWMKHLEPSQVRMTSVVLFGAFQLTELTMPARVKDTEYTALIATPVTPSNAGDRSTNPTTSVHVLDGPLQPYSWNVQEQLAWMPLPSDRSEQDPGPGLGCTTYSARQTEGGTKDYVYNVRDYGTLRPKLVYNCNLVPALCKNARNYLGGGTTSQFHFDAFRVQKKRDAGRNAKKSRVDARRDESCPTSWINNGRCPEGDQPDWTWKSGGQINPFVKAQMHVEDGVQHRNRLAKVEEVRVADTNEPLGYRVETQSTPYGAILSCDEFPAASWIEGGNGASTYCAPISAGCAASASTATEQDWQGDGHNALGRWFTAMAQGKLTPFSPKPDYTIFKFDYLADTTQGATVGDAVWVEVRGKKRYCFGPKPSTGSDCQPTYPDDPAPVNP
ncbi:hypothetical protein VDBG_05939 [Verticillium alfalfae VaMs.102]|uniref:F-box domain-containing protein n=1 Tax=Verticillium alfalfae (strain VaMs.102 / ATCC MYA-4576 / FGSC 10136) TaxID=526221 RepID=C9SM15_VERA1|nr:hypothetical protein VDBG_05939 [Verticillium alfalfae VaMs.102]EEY19830.1 hypothetical protein VDBG_05939 [Verticillium alfalfae VaMs.102]